MFDKISNIPDIWSLSEIGVSTHFKTSFIPSASWLMWVQLFPPSRGNFVISEWYPTTFICKIFGFYELLVLSFNPLGCLKCLWTTRVLGDSKFIILSFLKHICYNLTIGKKFFSQLDWLAKQCCNLIIIYFSSQPI